jgi:hypothetical protein
MVSLRDLEQESYIDAAILVPIYPDIFVRSKREPGSRAVGMETDSR